MYTIISGKPVLNFAPWSIGEYSGRPTLFDLLVLTIIVGGKAIFETIAFLATRKDAPAIISCVRELTELKNQFDVSIDLWLSLIASRSR